MTTSTRPSIPHVTTPDYLIGLKVVATIAMKDRNGLLPQRHIVVLYDETKIPYRAYSTHEAAWQDGYGWALCSGHYDMHRNAAMTDMIDRELSSR